MTNSRRFENAVVKRARARARSCEHFDEHVSVFKHLAIEPSNWKSFCQFAMQ